MKIFVKESTNRVHWGVLRGKFITYQKYQLDSNAEIIRLGSKSYQISRKV